MPIKRSAKKALRQSGRRRAHNLSRARVYKDAIKKAKKDATFLPQAYQAIDKAAKGGIIKNNNAARLKSRLARRRSG